MRLQECVRQLRWKATRENPAALARREMKKNNLTQAVWILCDGRGKRKKTITGSAVYAVAPASLRDKVSAAALFAKAVPNGLIAEPLDNGAFWIAVSARGIPIVGFDAEYARDDAIATVQQFLDDQDVPGNLGFQVFVPEGFPGRREDGAADFAALTAKTKVTPAVRLRSMERGIPAAAWIAGGFALLLVAGAGGFAWWRHQEAIAAHRRLMARLAMERARMAARRTQESREMANAKALREIHAEIGKLSVAWRQGLSPQGAEEAAALSGVLAPVAGWRPASETATRASLVVTWVPDAGGHPGVDSLQDRLRQNGWRVSVDAAWTRLTATKAMPDRGTPLRVNPGTSWAVWLHALPVHWRPGKAVHYPPLPDVVTPVRITGDGAADLSAACGILTNLTGVRIARFQTTLRAGGGTGTWAVDADLYEREGAS